MTKRAMASASWPMLPKLLFLLPLIWCSIASSFPTIPSASHRPRSIKGCRTNRRQGGGGGGRRAVLFAAKEASSRTMSINGGEAEVATAVASPVVVVVADEEHFPDEYVVTTKRKAKSKVMRKTKKKTVVKKKKTVVKKKTPVVEEEDGEEEEDLTVASTTSTTAAASKKKATKVTKGSKQKKKVTAPPIKKKKKKSLNIASSPSGDVDFWYNASSSSALVLINQTHVECTISGNPQPLRRHRTARGFMYNPSAKAQQCFQSVVEQVLGLSTSTSTSSSSSTTTTTKSSTKSSGRNSMIPLYNDDADDLIPTTHFGSDALLQLQLVCYCRRPKAHFISNKSGPGRLRLDAPRHVQRRIDVDNLAKFVLDSLNGILYADDQQVVSLHCWKVYDDDNEHCLGKSVVRIQVITPEELQEKIR